MSRMADSYKSRPASGQLRLRELRIRSCAPRLFFERRNLFADRRLPCSKLASDRRKAPAFDDADEYLDAFEPIHPILLRKEASTA